MEAKIKYRDEGGKNPLNNRDELYNAALDVFSKTPFHDAQINTILRNAKMNKGSFYFKFYDKLDLYLCMLERIGKDKTVFLSQKLSADSAPTDFFQQLRGIAQGTLEYARHDPRFYSYWRIYLSEGDELKKVVRNAFPELAVDFLGELTDTAIGNGQINGKYERSFVEFTVQTYFNNLDKLVDANMSDEEIIGKVEQVVSFLKDSLSSK